MKKCSFCGRVYSDAITVCEIDGKALPGLGADRKKVTGVWRGVYEYGKRSEPVARLPVAFTLKLKQGWLEHFTGSVTEDAPQGIPGPGTVDGYFKSPTLEFTKQMSIGYVVKPNGTRVTLREYIVAEGHKCEHDLPSPPILYLGTFLDANRVQGTWKINPHSLRIPGGEPLTLPGASGYWCAEFITADAKVNPAGGPTGSLFDKALLSPRELEDVEGVAMRSVGKFKAAEAEKFLDRFWQQDIRFQFKPEGDALPQITPITEVTGRPSGVQMVEIFVHPEDQDRILEIINAGE